MLAAGMGVVLAVGMGVMADRRGQRRAQHSAPDTALATPAASPIDKSAIYPSSRRCPTSGGAPGRCFRRNEAANQIA